MGQEISFRSGTTDLPLNYQTIGAALAEAMAAYPDREALVMPHQDIRWSWQELSAHVDDFAAGLLALGLEPQDRLAIWGPSRAEWIVTQLAAARIGLILVTINPAYRPPELQHALRLSGCRAIVLAERFKTSDYVEMLLEVAPELRTGVTGVRCANLPDLAIAIGMGRTVGAMIAFDEVSGRAASEHHARRDALAATVQPDDATCIQFTSGTTGAPKGATLTQFGVLNNGSLTAGLLGVTSADRVCVPVPLFHCFGMVVGVLGCVAHGATMVFPGEGFDPGEVLRVIQAERCSVLYGVPAMFIAQLTHPEFATFDLTSMRAGAMGAAPCPEDLMRRVERDMHIRDVAVIFGMTETSPVSFQARLDADMETRTATIGTVHPWLQARIADTEGCTVPIGVIGELHVRGYSVMKGYWGEPEKTAEAVDDAGWMHTGDLATMDAQGRCRIVGRSKDMIIRGGENVYPVEVENFFRTHDDIIDIAVFGMPDDLMGEEICAWIKATKPVDRAELKRFSAGRLSHFKIPRYVRLVDDFPMTASGKMHKPTMREAEASERVALSTQPQTVS